MPLDDHFAPSGFMGEGEVGNISADLECPERATGALGLCHHFTYTAGDIGWGGVWWQHPEGNWGDGPGLSMPSGLTSVSFKAWGVSGAEELSFGVGYGAVDGFSVKLSSVTLETSPQRYVIDLAGVPVEQLAGGFYWATEGDSAIEFYLDDLRFNDDPAEVNPCTVACAVAGAQEGCAGPDYVACAERCEAEVSGDCGAEALTLWTCLSEEGWRCGEEQRVGASTCDNAQDAFEECSGPAPVVSLPFSVSEHFIMSGYMGGGEVTLGECPEGRSSGCVKLTWAPNGAEWVGFYFQYPENNWGDLPGLEIESGATHVRYTAWGETGSERANFATGIADADGFNVESGYATLPDSPTQGFLELPEGITEVTGAFAWFLENPTGADEVVFYLDQVEWRGDELPGVEPGDIPGCTDAGADNYQEGATMNDGSCVYSVTFNVDMSCEEAPEDFNTVYITGPFCSWCDAGFPLSDEDGDGVWSGTYAFPAGPLEYKYMVDGFASQEDLIDDVQSNDGACAPVTDGSSYANRQTQVTAGGSTSDSYGRCAACDVAPPEPPMIGDFETVTFDNPEVTYSLLGFGGADDSTITTNEQFSEGRVARVLKSATAELWAGTTVVTGPNSSVGRLPIDAENTRLTVKVWSPHAGIPVRVKLEDASDPTVTVEAEATVSVADAEEVLTFDFAQQVSGTAALNPEATYNKLSIFFNFGQPGAEAGERVYYFDDITFIGGTSEPTGPTEASVTFEVDMTCPEAPESFGTVYVTGPFCNWCAEGFPLSDPDGDDVWSGTYTFPVGPLEYKLMVDGFASQEDLIDDVQAGDGACAPVTDGSNYANRQAQLSEDVTLSMVYGRCSACPGDGLAVDGLLTEQDGWRLTWSDEFNGPERSPVDPAKWTHDIGGSGWGNAQLEYNTDRVENVSHTGDGYLAITARREEFMGNGYTSARIKTQGLFSQQYGRFEARIQLPFGQGMWPAFWMLGDDIDQVSWPNCGEIDIMEYRGQEPQVSTGALHGPGYSGGASLYGTFSNGQSRATQFHIYAVEWSPESIKWFVDDELFMERSPGDVPSGSPWAFDHSFFMILNLAVGGNYVGSPDASTRFPQEMRVDYVRVYEQVTP